MTSFSACILKPRGPFHAGEREGMREGSGEFIHSDTLFSAICNCYLLLCGKAELERFLAAENAPNPPLVLSSAFPYWDGKFYFPMPRSFVPQTKETRRIRFIEQSAFDALLAGQVSEGELKRRSLPSGVVMTDDVPRVTVSRTGGSAQEEGGFYHVGLTYYKQGAALYFLMKLADDWRRKVSAAVRLMCDEGVGGYRTVGKGQFEQPVFTELVLNLNLGLNSQLLLSLYYPTEGEHAGLADGWYDLVQRKGYIFSPETRSLRRKAVSMFAEGSVFPGSERKGRLVDVTPEQGSRHSVYRNGLAFAIPCRGGSDA